MIQIDDHYEQCHFFLTAFCNGVICFLSFSSLPVPPALPPSLLVWICNHISCRVCIYGIWTKLFLFSHQIIVWSEMEWWRSINSPPVLLCLYHCFGYERLVTSVVLLIFTTLIISVSFFLSSLFQLHISYTSFFYNIILGLCWNLESEVCSTTSLQFQLNGNVKNKKLYFSFKWTVHKPFCQLINVYELVVGEVSSVNPNIFSFISKQLCQIFILYLFWICIRNFWSISTRSCNWEPTQTLKWFIACILSYLYSTECPADTISRCSWLNIGKFFKYPFLIVGILLCTFFFCFLGRVPNFVLFKLYIEQRLIFLNHSNRSSYDE